MGIGARIAEALVGKRFDLPAEMIARYPELAEARYRRGGLPVRIGGLAPGVEAVAAVTLRRTVFLAPDTQLSAGLLLHELRHVHQFLERATFPVRYLWQSLRYGYSRNAYEVDARRYSALRLGSADEET
ncbi:MAG: hypothetical protein WD802_12410 [Gemmatimonadaceae bacterium]